MTAHPLAPELRQASARDLAWLVASLVLVIAPHMLRAPWWLTLLTLCLYGWRLYFALNRAPLPSRWLVLGVAAVAMLGVWIEFRTLFGRQAGILLLMLFSGLKLLETRTHRDAAIGAFLGYFLIITNFLYTQTIPTALAMGVGLFLLTTTLIGFNAPSRPPRANLRSAGVLIAHAAPAALALFLLFPRVQGPLWGLPQDAYAGMTGLSDTMTPGSLASLAQSDAIAFRAEFQGEPPPAPLRYWRGPVLWDFDGRTWSIGPSFFVEFAAPRSGRGTYRYEVVLEPHNRFWLFALETAASLPQSARMSFDGQVIANSPVRSRLRYELASVIAPQAEPRDSAGVLRRALRLPPESNPRASALAAQWREASADDAEVLARAIAFLKQGRYLYTLEPPLLGVNSVDQFLFVTKEGFCEHFSSAFVFLMRAAGIPARVVTGYQGGEYNPINGYLLVRQSEAHAWSEVWLDGRGWVRVDPTAAVAPDRIERGIAAALAEGGESLPGSFLRQNALFNQLRLAWDATNTFWNTQVVAFGEQQQRWLLERLNLGDGGWQQLGIALVLALIVFFAAMSVYLGWRFRPRAKDPLAQIYDQLCRKLARRGLPRAAHEGPSDYVARVLQVRPELAPLLVEARNLYVALRYGPRSWGPQLARSELSRLKFLVNQLKV